MRRRRRRNKRTGYTPPEVTLTPLIDTALTLLIIFMVTTPMINNAIRVDLPHGQAQEGGKEPNRLVVAIDKDENVFFNNMPVTLDQVGKEVKEYLAQMATQEEQRVWVNIDKTNSCDTLIKVIDSVKVIGGVKDVAVATRKAA